MFRYLKVNLFYRCFNSLDMLVLYYTHCIRYLFFPMCATPVLYPVFLNG